jgi:hypothetical protein
MRWSDPGRGYHYPGLTREMIIAHPEADDFRMGQSVNSVVIMKLLLKAESNI